ncbi:hypothetical protein ACWC2T_33965 [Streptomyces sp. NPDC001393]
MTRTAAAALLLALSAFATATGVTTGLLADGIGRDHAPAAAVAAAAEATTVADGAGLANGIGWD